MAEAAVETRTRALGEELLADLERYRPRAAERLQDWLLTDALADDAFRGRLLRFIDVFAAVETTGDAEELQRLLREYFPPGLPHVPRALRWLLRIARDPLLPASALLEATRRAVALFARRFIADPDPRAMAGVLDGLQAAGRLPSLDLLGEAVLSEGEADADEARYRRLLADLAAHPLAGTTTRAGDPALQVSLKLSSLTYRFTPVDLDGSVARVAPRLERIAAAARAAGVGLCVDAEQYETRDVVWAAWQRTFGAGGPHADWRGAGMVVQAYLRDADRHLDAVIAAAQRRGVPFQVRLVKGAYWDAETIGAAAQRWAPPVFQAKAATDQMYERLLARLIAGADVVAPAVASHNPRAHALAEALAEARGLPPGAVEHQTLHRTLEALSAALARRGWTGRDYVPVGALIPGMAYLVRRILENASQAGFLTMSRSGRLAPAILAPPPAVDDPAVVAPDGAPFERAPGARWFDAAFRAGFQAALAAAAAAPATRWPLPPGLPAGAWAPVRDPSHPDAAPLAAVEHAGPDAMRAAIGRAGAAADTWAARPVTERAALLRRAADRLLARGHEFAAAIVREGGREREGAWAEVEEAVDFLRLYAQAAETLWTAHGAVIAPRGVVAVIPPWNFSLAIPCGMTAAALACGNPVILKPATETPVVAHRLVALLQEAGVPADVLQCVPGAGRTAGRVLVEDPGVAMVAFTGSRAVGTWMHEAVAQAPDAAGRPRTLIAEMGGKNPALVFADADIDEAVAGVLRSAFGHANQKCSAVSRVLVARPVLDRFRARLVDAARSWQVGPADDPATVINPLISARAAERLAAAAARARAEGTVVLDAFAAPGGAQRAGPLIVEVPPAAALARATTTEELFGPILALIPFDDAAEAYRIANGTGYGLTAGLFSRSPAELARAERAIAAGHLYVNRATTAARPGVEPFGGMHFSGTGPKVGHDGYLWAFVRRTDAPPIAADVEPDDDPDGASDPTAAAAGALPAAWAAPLEERLAVVEAAARRLEASPFGAQLRATADAARRELGRPAATVAVAGQQTTMRYDYPLGRGILRGVGPRAATWLAASLLAGNGVLVVGSPGLAPAVAALHGAGVPAAALRVADGDAARFLQLARAAPVEFVVADAAPMRSLARAIGPTHAGQAGLKTLLTTLDGPQPGERGFLQRFAWPRVTAIRTLRHGADLRVGLDPDA